MELQVWSAVTLRRLKQDAVPSVFNVPEHLQSTAIYNRTLPPATQRLVTDTHFDIPLQLSLQNILYTLLQQRNNQKLCNDIVLSQSLSYVLSYLEILLSTNSEC